MCSTIYRYSHFAFLQHLCNPMCVLQYIRNPIRAIQYICNPVCVLQHASNPICVLKHNNTISTGTTAASVVWSRPSPASSRISRKRSGAGAVRESTTRYIRSSRCLAYGWMAMTVHGRVASAPFLKNQFVGEGCTVPLITRAT